MKPQRTYPNLIWILFAIVPCLFVIWFGLSIAATAIGVQVPFLLQAREDAPAAETDVLVMLLVVSFSFVVLGIYGLLVISKDWTMVLVFDDRLVIVRPLRAMKRILTLTDIKGYSNSQDCVRTTNHSDSALWCSDSVIIYTKDNQAFEVIKLYNWNFSIVERALETANIPCLGFEPYWKEGFFRVKRRFKFKD